MSHGLITPNLVAVSGNGSQSIMSIISRTGTANTAIADERRKSLRSLSHEEAWRIYRDLCYTWEQNPNKQGLERLERKRIQHLLELREKLDQIGGRGRNGHTAKCN